MPDFELDHEIQFDADYTGELNARMRARFGSSGPRNATHATDLLYCLRKAWAKRIKAEEAEEGATEQLEDDTIMTWLGGLQFEELISEGETQPAQVYCSKCKTVGSFPGRRKDGKEQANCSVCGERWLVFTPDYIVDGIVHEVKQTRKSRRRGPTNAPWWIDQLRTYLMFKRMAGKTSADYGRLVVNWIMGDYGSSKKGEQPRGPRAALDAFRVIFKDGFEGPWRSELMRRKRVTEGDEMPALSGMELEALSPQYDWECSSCPIGEELECENFPWRDGKLPVEEVEEEAEDGGD